MDPGCGLQGSFDARLVARPWVRAGHLVGNSRVYGIIENMYYIPTRLEMHDGLCMGTSVERVCGRGPGPGCRVPTWTEATDSDRRQSRPLALRSTHARATGHDPRRFASLLPSTCHYSGARF